MWRSRWYGTGRWRDESGAHPSSFLGRCVDVIDTTGYFVKPFFPVFGERWDGRIVFATGPYVRLLGTGETHRTPTPIGHERIVMQFEIFTKLPTPSLLLATRRTIVRQVCVGIIIKETWHISVYVFVRSIDMYIYIQSDTPCCLESSICACRTVFVLPSTVRASTTKQDLLIEDFCFVQIK